MDQTLFSAVVNMSPVKYDLFAYVIMSTLFSLRTPQTQKSFGQLDNSGCIESNT